ncbi:MAG: GNAT family N-acetyltransferase [Euzebya sp.]
MEGPLAAANIDVGTRDDLSLDLQLQAEVARCWMDVSNAGGAVGFPFLPVGLDKVSEAVRHLGDEVDRGEAVLFEAREQGLLVGWVTLRLNQARLTSHWATVERLQSHPTKRGLGIGDALLRATVEHGRGSGLHHLLLVLRAGEGLEPFYERLGWTQVGRHPSALRLRAGDDRDEVIMTLPLQP